MKTIKFNSLIVLFMRFFISVLFIFSGIEKISQPEDFARAVENYQILPLFLVNIVALWIPWIELVVGVLLLFGLYKTENLTISLGLISFFTLLVIIAVLRGLNIECGCFGTIGAAKIGVEKIAENIFLLLLVVYQLKFSDPPAGLFEVKK